MSPLHTRGGKRAMRGGGGPVPPPPLSPASIEAIGRFIRILARCGARPADIIRAVRSAAEQVPPNWVARARRMTHYNEGAGHVLTAWFCETAYLDPFGKPRALPLKGPSRSVAALVKSVDPRFDVREVLSYLMRTGAVRRQGRCYVPRARALFLRGTQGPDYVHTQVVLTHMLATLEHNIHLKRATQGWFEYFAENRQFPARARAELDKYVAMLGKEILSRLDTYMHRREVNRRPGEPTLRVGIGMHLWEGERPRGGAGRRASRLRAARRPR
jgi:Family of unknown function (DUF6502)